MRILICTHAPANERTAVYRSISDRAQFLRTKGHVVDILTADDLMTRRVPRLDPLLLPIAVAPRVAHYDVVLFHSYLGWAFHLLRHWFDPAKRVKTITSFHGLEPLYQQALSDEYTRQGLRLSARYRLLHHVIVPWLLRASCRRSDALFCLNTNEVAYVTQHRWADRDRVHLTSNGVAPECFVTRTHRPHARRLLFVGQWLPAKGTRYLVDAFAELASRRDVELVCAGTGAPSDVVLSAFPVDARSHVRVVPTMNRDGLYRELVDADLFVFPSLSEGFSCALLEALAAGLPTIATRAGAAADLLKHDDNAVVIPFADAHAIVAAVDRLIDDRARRQHLSAAARSTAMRYTLDKACASFAGDVCAIATKADGSQSVGALVGGDAL
ncbi:MAG TPA: glycosyltransferase family 4 protein [Vicinamibacterales bacterium]